MARRSSNVLLAVANLLIPVAVLVFATGFFPYKPFLPGLARYGDIREYGFGDPPDAPFDKIILMVVDALRTDFVYSDASGFKFTQRYVQDCLVVGLTRRRACGAACSASLWDRLFACAVFRRSQYRHLGMAVVLLVLTRQLVSSAMAQLYRSLLMQPLPPLPCLESRPSRPAQFPPFWI